MKQQVFKAFTILFQLLALSYFAKVGYAQIDAPPEIFFGNLSTTPARDVYFRIYPVSFVFNGSLNYDLEAKLPDTVGSVVSQYIGGLYLANYPPGSLGLETRVPSGSTSTYGPRHDSAEFKDGAFGAVGFGKYKIEILDFLEFADTLTIEYDAAHPGGLPADVSIYFRNDTTSGIGGSGPRVTFKWADVQCEEQNISIVNRRVENWNHCSQSYRSKYLGNFYYGNSSPLSIVPLDARNDCYTFSLFPIQNQQHSSHQSGVLTLNLTIEKDIHTRDTLIDFPTNIVITKKVALKLAANRTFDIIPHVAACDSCYTNLIVGDSAFLILYGGSKIIVRAPNKFTLEQHGSLTLALGSSIIFKPGSTFCYKGGRINGFSNGIIFEKGLHGFPCDLESPLLIEDSCRIVLNDSATVSFPDNFTLHLKGDQTALVVNPGSKLLFGENSGIICDSGARIIANDATFASVDSTKKWNGISLSDPSSDTIRNCTIKNAMYGIALSGKYDPDESPNPYSAEILGCSFVNQTSYVLNNAIYLENSAHVLVKDNTVTSTSLGIGFTHGVYAEYCPGEMLNIINNSISNCNNGMTVIQSSPYIAFNTINGNTYGESGMFLDNSNGTIKYNVISDFYISYYSFYSSPDLLKNTFDNSCDDNIYLSSSSVPVMHPFLSGGSTYWFAGDNHVTGSSYDAGILFDEDANPDLNYGYNRFTLNGSNYYISGINPAEGAREFYAVQNYWQDNPPDSSMFNVSNADSVVYTPWDNNSSSARETNAVLLDSIGFGLFDTVHYYDADNPNHVQELMLSAYQIELAGDYEGAIAIYKEIVADTAAQNSVPACIARIFNCHDRMITDYTDYTDLEFYCESIAGDTTFTEIARNVSQDIAIQCKIKQGRTEEAISDYEDIYTSNLNIPKGIHALINKEILNAGAGDNSVTSSSIELIESKQHKINAILKGLKPVTVHKLSKNTETPTGFELYQNYPNPFNPKTIINFQLRIKIFVSLKVYDITGKEVATLVNNIMPAGRHAVEFNAADLPSGVYFCALRVTSGQTLKAGSYQKTLRMAVVK